MATNAENAATGLAAIYLAIAEWEYAKPTYMKEGQMVAWTAHMAELLKSVEIAKRAAQLASGPFIVSHRGR